MKNLKYFPYERNKYFYGKLLSVSDFQTEQKYMNDKRRLINRFLHGCGVVCGLNVVQVDDYSLSLETGLALDFAGREIVVDMPVMKNLSMIEGFDAYSEADEMNSYLYLCIEYAEKEKEAVYNVSGSSSNNEEYNKVAEGYRIYLTNREPENGNFSNDAYYETQKTVYWGNGVRISQVFPKYVKSGEEFECRLIVENMGQKLPISFSYQLSLDCLSQGGKNRMELSFDEESFEKSRKYEIPFLMTAAAVKNVKGQAALLEDSFRLKIGGRRIEARAEGSSQVKIVREEIEDVISAQYYQEAMEEIIKDTYHQSIYLAKIGVVQAGSTYVIDGIQQMPFKQYVYNDVLAAVMNRINEEKLKKMERERQSHTVSFSGIPEGKDQEKKDAMQMAAGTVTIDLGIGGSAGQKFFSQEITHGLGLGNVHIVLGESLGGKDDSSVIYGAEDIFDEKDQPIRMQMAARSDVAKGTFVIGLKLLETTTVRKVKIHWMAVRDRKESRYDREERSLFVSPDMVSLKLRETYYFKGVFSGTKDCQVTWKVKEAEGGTIDGNGMYTAPNIPGVFEVIAESKAYPELKASAFVVVKE